MIVMLDPRLQPLADVLVELVARDLEGGAAGSGWEHDGAFEDDAEHVLPAEGEHDRHANCTTHE